MFIITYLCTGEFYNMLCYPWFSSGILLLVLLSLIDQPFFSKDSNIFVNAVTAFIALAVIPNNQKDIVYTCMLYLDIYLLISSYILMWIRKVPSRENHKIIKLFSGINNFFGKPQILFSAFFLWSAIMEFGFENNKYKALFFYWVVIILIDTTKVCNFLSQLLNNTNDKSEKNALGSIIGVQGKNIFLVKLFPNSQREPINLFDSVELNFKKHSYKGLIIETYILNEEQWVKVLTNKELTSSFALIKNEGKLKEDVLYKLPIPKELDVPFIKSFVGIVTDNSKIDKIFFTYDSKVEIESGYLLEVRIKNKKVIYQIIDGITKQELLEAKNKSGFIIAEAIQLGIWDAEQNRFLKFGWVPEINTPVHIISKYPIIDTQNDFIKIGTIPNSNLPIYIDIEKAISHHLAILGVTGTGKSVFVRYLLNQYIKKNKKKVFFFDFTGEHKKKIHNFNTFMPASS